MPNNPEHCHLQPSLKQQARGEVITNGIESLFDIFKRGMTGIYLRYGEQHLQPYLEQIPLRSTQLAG
jgi:hypothetical protein